MITTLKFVVNFLDTNNIQLPKNKAALAKILWTYSKEFEALITEKEKLNIPNIPLICPACGSKKVRTTDLLALHCDDCFTGWRPVKAQL